MDSLDRQEIVDAIDQLRSAVESLEMRISSLESSAGRRTGGAGGIEQRLDQINRTVEAIRREMF